MLNLAAFSKCGMSNGLSPCLRLVNTRVRLSHPLFFAIFLRFVHINPLSLLPVSV